MKTSIITTINHNVGDDFVREGIQFLLRQAFGCSNFSLIHKHIPLTVRPEWEWYYLSGLSRLLDRLPRAKGLFWSRLIDRLPCNAATDKILTADLLVQSGAPVYWKGAHTNEWFEPLIRNRYCAITRNVPFLNIGAGTCLPYHSEGSEILSDPECTAYIRELHALSTVTTLRDSLSHSILNRLGLDAPVLPCPSIFARDNLKVDPKIPEYIVLNFMPLGGHYDFGQAISSAMWEKTFADFYRSVSCRERVLFVCHDTREYAHVHRIAPGAPRFIGQSARDYLEVYSRARYFIGCRVHGAFATASFGRPAFIVGSDTRARMTEQIGLQNVFVSDTSPDVLLDAADRLNRTWKEYDDCFRNIRNMAYNSYQDLLSLKDCFR
ncbi:MAG: polysaccharide pyruvyl transferase family protein [Desulfuromonadales bacterium]|nr:polysaccharide pyruvyl transferase family protein [Desulfuromonadales bacterium]